MAAPRVERGPEHDLHIFDDLRAHIENMQAAMLRADEIIAAADKGDPTAALPPAQRALPEKAKKQALAAELAVLTGQLKAAVDSQLQRGGTIARIDLSDGSYDNASIDNRLRILYSRIRNMKMDLGGWFSFKRTRKFFAWMGQDVPNWFNVKSRQVVDGAKQALKLAGVVGTVAAAGYGGYLLYNGGWAAVSGAAGTAWDKAGALKGYLGTLFGGAAATP